MANAYGLGLNPKTTNCIRNQNGIGVRLRLVEQPQSVGNILARNRHYYEGM